MNTEKAEVELYLRKYQWALTNFTRETEEGYPFLKTLSDSSVQRFLIHIEQFPAMEQRELATLILKNWYRPAMQLLGEVFTQEDEARSKSYYTALRSIVLPGVSSSPITKTFTVKRADTAKITLSFLSAAFGTKPEKFFSLNWFYTAPVGDWQFRTELDFGGTWGTEIRCSHRLIRNDSKNWGLMMMSLPSAVGPIRVPQYFSLLSLYGLPFGVYNIQTTDDVQITAQTILDAYNRLFQAIPGWVDDLTID